MRSGFHDDGTLFAGDGGGGAGQLFLRDGQRQFYFRGVELAGSLHKGLVASGAHIVDDGAHLILDVESGAVGRIAAFGQTLEKGEGVGIRGGTYMQNAAGHDVLLVCRWAFAPGVSPRMGILAERVKAWG